MNTAAVSDLPEGVSKYATSTLRGRENPQLQIHRKETVGGEKFMG